MTQSYKEVPSTKPYLVRALYDWCVDHGFTPYLAVFVDAQVAVPMEYVKNGEIVLNISPDACQAIKIDNEYISFNARFGGVPREIFVPITHVMGIYAKENGQGMSFPIQIPEPLTESELDSKEKAPEGPASKSRSHLKLVK